MSKNEYNKLKEIINYHMNKYYNEDNPEISDYEYDMLMAKLKTIEEERPEWITKDSPTQKIGGVTKSEAGEEITHNVPMLSIKDVFEKKDVISWINKVHSIHPDCTFSVEAKIDGLSLTLRYSKIPNQNKMKLTMAETRGDGHIGETALSNALVIADIKKEIDFPYDYLELRGEVYMNHDDFERFNNEQERLGKKPAANPRNLAAGTLRQRDSEIVRERNLKMFIFNVQDGPKEIMENHINGLNELNEKGIPVAYHKLCKTTEDVLNAIDKIAAMRNELPYDIDGAVVKINETDYRNDFPAGSKYSAGHIAFKYPPEEKEVVMESIEETVGRTGKIAFIGHVYDKATGKPARLCGTSVSRVTLHNQDYINEMKIGIGGTYLLKKSGDIIPKLCGVVTEPKEIYVASSTCPICGQPVVREEDTADIRCINSSCPAQLLRTISYFTSRDCMNIMGLSDATLEKFINKGFIKSFADIYHLSDYKNEIIEIEGFGEKSYNNLMDSIGKSRNVKFAKLLCAIGIPGVGKDTAKLITKSLGADPLNGFIEKLRLGESFDNIEGIGPIINENIYKWKNNRKNGEDFANLVDELVIEKEEVPKNTDELPFAGKTFVITGSVEHFANRNEIKEYIEKNGGKVAGSVSAKTSYLVNNDITSNSGKNKKAKELGIKIITEEELLNF